MTSSSSSDINPVLLAAGAILEFRRAGNNDSREILLQDFFMGDHRIAMNDDEVLVSIRIPLPKSSNKYFIQSYKQARRRDDSKGIISAGLQVQLESSGEDNNQWRIVSTAFSFGGMASLTILAKNTQEKLIGQLWTRETIDKACQMILEEMPLDEMSPGGKPEYR